MFSRRSHVCLGLILVIVAGTAASQSWVEKLKREAERIDDQLDTVTAQSTANSTPAFDPRISLNPDTQNCRGRWGTGCDGFMTDMRNPAKVEFPCEGDNEIVCITSGMSIGSIKHDMCCDAEQARGVIGHWCGPGNRVSRGEMTACEAEWDQAKWDWQANRKFSYTWRYRVGSNSTTETHNWWFGLAPDGIEVSQSDPQADRTFCHSNEVLQTDGQWVCGTAAAATQSPAANHAIPTATGTLVAQVAPTRSTSGSGKYCLSNICLGDRIADLKNLDWGRFEWMPKFRDTKFIIGVSDDEYRRSFDGRRNLDKTANFLAGLDLICASYNLIGYYALSGERVLLNITFGVQLNPGGWQGLQVVRIARTYSKVQSHQMEEWEKLILSTYPDATKSNSAKSNVPQLREAGNAPSTVYYSTGRPPTLVLENTDYDWRVPQIEFRAHPGCPSNDVPLSLD